MVTRLDARWAAGAPSPVALRPARAPASAGTRREAEPEREAGPGRGRRLLCRACAHPVTSEGEAIAVDGGHRHRRTNPHGLEFDFGCFAPAPGAVAVGSPSRAHTWFARHAWSVSLCAGCGEHLGWCFRGEAPPRFHGLILERLEPEPED